MMMFLMFFLLSLLGCVSSSHFRGGIFMVRPSTTEIYLEGSGSGLDSQGVGSGVTEVQMEIFFHKAWRRSSGYYCDASTIRNGQLIGGEGSISCSGCSEYYIGSTEFRCTDFSSTEDWTFGENTLSQTIPLNANRITIGYSGCCWILPGGSWNIQTTFSTIPRSDTSVINSTPRAITSPVIRLQEGCNNTIRIPVTDPDNDIIKCRWAVGSECSGACNLFPEADLDSDSCTITYDDTNTGTGNKIVALTIEDFAPNDLSAPLSQVGLQFVVNITNNWQSCSQLPVFRSPTPMQGTCVAIGTNHTFTTQVIADSHSTTNISIAEIATTSPSGTIKGDLYQIDSSTSLYYVNISWTPTTDQYNQIHALCYTAINSDGLASEQTCIQIDTRLLPPEPNQGSLSPANNAIVNPTNTIWSVQFNKGIQRPSVSAFIRFHNATNNEAVYAIDALSSFEVNIVNSSNLFITPSFTFPEAQSFFITFDRGIVNAIGGCEAGNNPISDSNFWKFETPKPVSTSITVDPAGVIELGSEVVITCHATGNPMPTIQWYKDGMSLSPSDDELSIVQVTYNTTNVTSILTIPSVMSSHEGNYTCNGTNFLPNGMGGRFDYTVFELTIYAVDESFYCNRLPHCKKRRVEIICKTIHQRGEELPTRCGMYGVGTV